MSMDSAAIRKWWADLRFKFSEARDSFLAWPFHNKWSSGVFYYASFAALASMISWASTKQEDTSPGVAVASAMIVSAEMVILFRLAHVELRERAPSKDVGSVNAEDFRAMVAEVGEDQRQAGEEQTRWITLLVLIHGAVFGALAWFDSQQETPERWWPPIMAVAATLLAILCLAALGALLRGSNRSERRSAFVRMHSPEGAWSEFLRRGHEPWLSRVLSSLVWLAILALAQFWVIAAFFLWDTV